MIDAASTSAELLSEDERERFEAEGYVVLRDVLSPEFLAFVRERTGTLEAGDHVTSGGAHVASDLLRLGTDFEFFRKNSRVLAYVEALLGKDYRLDSLNMRCPLPGEGFQPLHVDWPDTTMPDKALACQSLWLLDDWTEENGPTRIVPGSHRFDRVPSHHRRRIEGRVRRGKVWRAYNAARRFCGIPTRIHREYQADEATPGQMRVIAPAGSVIIIHAHLWHSGTDNRNGLPRRAIQAFFIRDGVEQPTPRQPT